MSASATTCSRRAHWKIKWAGFAVLGLLGLAGTGRSAETERWIDRLGLSGTSRVSFFTKAASFADASGVQCDSLWITARPQDCAGIKTYLDTRIQAQFTTGNSRITADLREGYFDKAVGNFDFKIGRQIVVWGRADKINPTDAWSVRNDQLLVTDDDDQRVGTTAAQAVWNIGAEHMIAIWQPEFRFPVLPLPPLPTGTSLANIAASPKTDQLGLKYDHSGAGVDWSLSYAHPINRTPDLVLLESPTAVANRTRLGLSYNFADVLGADAAVPIGKYGLRGEVAYTHARNPGGLNPLAQNNNLFAVLGVERTWEGELNVNVQYLFRRYYDYRGLDLIDDPRLRNLAEQARMISNQFAPDMQGASLRVDYKAFNETLETEISVAAWFKKSDSILTAKVSYAFTDRTKGVLGADVFSGPTDSFFGRLRSISTAFLELRFGL